MIRRSRKNLISVMLIACLTATVLFIPALQNESVYAAEQSDQAVLTKSKITVPGSMIAGTRFTMTLTGDRQKEKGTTEGETRYIPYSYAITHSDGVIKSPLGLVPNSSGNYSYSIKFTDPGNKTVEATWLKQKYTNGKWQNTGTKEKTSKVIAIKGTLKLNANGGTVKTKSIYLKQSAKAGTLPAPKRSGYIFSGWYTAKYSGSRITDTTKIKFTSSTKTLYARWSSIKGSYKITLNPNGGTVSPTKMTVIKWKKYNSVRNLPTPKRTNYNFTGWYTAKSGGSKVSNATVVKKTKKHTLYARWKNKYTVTLNANGGKLSDGATKTVTLGKTYGTLSSPKRTNYIFNGWYTAQNGGTKITSTSVVSLKANQTLYARWQSNGSIESKNGDIISSYDDAAKSIIKRIGTQGKSQCAVYSMSYCTAIKSKKYVAPTTYLIGDLANWYTGGMNRLDYSGQSNAQTKVMTIIKNQIDNNLPCIIRCTYGTSGQHWVTVVGYKPNATVYSDLYILDPAVSDVTQIYLFYNTKYYFPKDGYVGVATY